MRYLYNLIAIVTLSTLVAAKGFCADPQVLKKYGVPFAVENLVDLSAQSVEVTVLGKTTVTTQAELLNFVVDQYLHRSQQDVLPARNLQKFFAESVKATDLAYASKSFEALLRHSQIRQAELVDLVELLERTSIATRFYRDVLRRQAAKKKFSKVMAACLFFAGMDNIEWLRSDGQVFTSLYGRELKAYVQSRFYTYLAQQDIETASGVLNFVEEIYSRKDPIFKRLSKASEVIGSGIKAIENGQIDGAYPLIDLIINDQKLAQEFGGVLVDKLHTRAKQELARGNIEETLEVLALVQLRWRTETTHKIVAEALSKVNGSFELGGAGSRSENFLTVLARKDEEIEKRYLEYLDKRADFLIETDDPDGVEQILRTILIFRIDPDNRNDEIRMAQAKLYKSQGNQARAVEVIKGRKTKFSFFERIWLLLSGLYVSRTSVLLLFISPFIIGGGAWLFRKQLFDLVLKVLKGRSYHGRRYDSFTDNEDDVSDEVPLFSAQGGLGINPKAYEYQQCLDLFELPHAASMKDIKAAHRKVVKELHPDRKKNATEEDAQKFIELTKTYERLLVLRKELGMD